MSEKAVVIDAPGGPEQLKLVEVDVGAPGPGEIRIRHAACGLNYIDVYQRTGLYPSQLPAGLGEEAAGVVEALGDGVTGLKVGDRVVYNGLQGGYASHRNAPAEKMVLIPDYVKDEDAAAVFLKGLTVWMLFGTWRHVRHRGVLPHTADNAATDAAAAVAADLHHRLQAELRSASDTSG